MKHKKREPRCIKCGSDLVWPGRKICQRCLNIMGGSGKKKKENEAQEQMRRDFERDQYEMVEQEEQAIQHREK